MHPQQLESVQPESDVESPHDPGSVDATLADAFPDTRLEELSFHRGSAGALVVTAPEQPGTVVLETTEAGLTAEQVTAPVADSDLTRLEHFDPAPTPPLVSRDRAEFRRRGD